MMAHSTLFLLFSTLLGSTAAAETVTLMTFALTTTDAYGIPPVHEFASGALPWPELSYSAAGVGSDGLTTYVEQKVKSQDYWVGPVPTATTTLSNGMVSVLESYEVSTSTFPATTQHVTIVAGATEQKYETPVQAAHETEINYVAGVDCHWDKDWIGECEMKIWHQTNPADTLYTVTQSGTFAPLYTLVAPDTSASQQSSASRQPASESQQPSASATSSAPRQIVAGASTCAVVLAFASFFMLFG